MFVGLTAEATTILVVNNGILMGARGVNVEGTLYDVDFVDGTCLTAYGLCDPAHLPFNGTASFAAQALLDQVFVNADFPFDWDASLTFGCTGIGGPAGQCFIYTPYAFDPFGRLFAIVAINYGCFPAFCPLGLPDVLELEPSDRNARQIWAKWTPVPEPPTLTSSLISMFVLVSFLHRHRQRQRRL